MKIFIILLIIFSSQRYSLASCGPAPDPLGEALIVSYSKTLADSLRELLDSHEFVAIARVDSFYCLDTIFGYPTYDCDVRVTVDSVIKGELLYPVFYSRTSDYIGNFLADLSRTKFLLYDTDGQTKEIHVRSGCYSPHSGYYLSDNKLHNQRIEPAAYLPLDSLGWFTGSSPSGVYQVWPNNTACMTTPCRSLSVATGFDTPVTVSGILDTAGNSLSGEYLFQNYVQGHFEEVQLEGWISADTVLVVEKILGTYVYRPSGILSVRPSGNKADETGLYDALGRYRGRAKYKDDRIREMIFFGLNESP